MAIGTCGKCNRPAIAALVHEIGWGNVKSCDEHINFFEAAGWAVVVVEEA